MFHSTPNEDDDISPDVIPIRTRESNRPKLKGKMEQIVHYQNENDFPELHRCFSQLWKDLIQDRISRRNLYRNEAILAQEFMISVIAKLSETQPELAEHITNSMWRDFSEDARRYEDLKSTACQSQLIAQVRLARQNLQKREQAMSKIQETMLVLDRSGDNEHFQTLLLVAARDWGFMFHSYVSPVDRLGHVRAFRNAAGNCLESPTFLTSFLDRFIDGAGEDGRGGKIILTEPELRSLGVSVLPQMSGGPA
ncbi:MAG TPA: hypothetical protein PLK94_02065 [Alphaproteobacteria bacterium]|nr:hypothetical protein [Alphaproteobacteria bacterium]HOO50054.1 hypothetical protein [Alphaproteobacteria bacterium]